jgi:hypothetical protein
MVYAGMAGAAGPASSNPNDDVLRDVLVEAGRRTLGLRTPRRSAQSHWQERDLL